MTTLHDLCHHELHRWQVIVNQHLVHNVMDQYIPKDILPVMVSYITPPHPCSHQIRRFKRDRLRRVYSRVNLLNMLFHHKYRYDEKHQWFHFKHQDDIAFDRACSMCNNPGLFDLPDPDYTVDDYVQGRGWHQIIGRNLNEYTTTQIRIGIASRCVLYSLPTIDVKQVLMNRQLYHPEGIGAIAFALKTSHPNPSHKVKFVRARED